VTILKQLDHFDPELHEAIAQVDSPTHESGAIVDVVQKGYMFNGQVLRVARVTVAK
jgi:molecular chaperone GrpE